jgi:hypothetical protein
MTSLVVRTLAATVVGVGMIGIFTAPASASHGGGGNGVQERGSCSGGGAFKLKAKHDDGRIEVEYQVDTNRAGQVWHVRLTDNGTRFFNADRRTSPPSGSFEINRRVTNRPGSDTIRAHATFNHRTCGGRVTV